VDRRHYRLGQMHDCLHHRAAGIHDLGEIGAPAIGISATGRQFLHVVARGEGRTVGRDHHRAHLAIVVNFPERRMQLGDQAFREAVAGFGPIEREHADAAQRLAQKNWRLWCGGACGPGGHRAIHSLAGCHASA
jgi:hypothetical protein